jgi:hypothetical protein
MVAKPIAEKIVYRETALVDHDGLAVGHASADAEAFDGRGDLGETRREIVAVACTAARLCPAAPGCGTRRA